MGGSGIAAGTMRQLVRVSTANFQLPRNVGDQVRPWQLSIMPLIIDESEWKQVSAGLAQRVRVLERVLGDILGEQHLLRKVSCLLNFSSQILSISGPSEIYLFVRVDLA